MRWHADSSALLIIFNFSMLCNGSAILIYLSRAGARKYYDVTIVIWAYIYMEVIYATCCFHSTWKNPFWSMICTNFGLIFPCSSGSSSCQGKKFKDVSAVENTWSIIMIGLFPVATRVDAFLQWHDHLIAIFLLQNANWALHLGDDVTTLALETKLPPWFFT